MSTSKSQVKHRTSNVTNLMTISRKFGSRKVQRLTEAGSLRAVRPTNLIFNTNKLHKRSTSKDPFSFLFVCLFVSFFTLLFNLVPRAFPLKIGCGPTHFLREKPWGRGWLLFSSYPGYHTELLFSGVDCWSLFIVFCLQETKILINIQK